MSILISWANPPTTERPAASPSKNAPWYYNGPQPTVRSQAKKEQIVWPSLGAESTTPVHPHLPRSQTHNSQRSQWRRATGNYKSPTDPITCLAKRRLQTGHCLQVYLKQTGITDSALCDSKESEPMVHHMLLDCSRWQRQRHQSWSQDETSTNKLEWLTCAAPSSLAVCGLGSNPADWLQKKNLMNFVSKLNDIDLTTAAMCISWTQLCSTCSVLKLSCLCLVLTKNTHMHHVINHACTGSLISQTAE